jgi:hypothetical protein
MSSEQVALMRESMRVRESGELGEALAMMRGRISPAEPVAGLFYMRTLAEIGDHAALQTEARRALNLLTSASLKSENAEYLTALLYLAERCCFPGPWIQQALNAMAATARIAPELRTAHRAVLHRQKFRDQLAERYSGWASIISLGLNCLPWHLPGRWGLRKPRDFVSLFNPFSLAGHSAQGVIDALQDDFQSYCSADQMRAVSSQRGHEFALRKDRGAFWNHNRGTYWLRNDMAALRESLADKAERFRAAVKRRNAVFLMATCPVEYPQEPLDFLPRLNAALARFTGTERNRIIISNQTARRAEPGLHRVDDQTFFFYCPYPTKEYVWHDDDEADTKVGLTFERSYVTFLVRARVEFGVFGKQAGAAQGSRALEDAS